MVFVWCWCGVCVVFVLPCPGIVQLRKVYRLHCPLLQQNNLQGIHCILCYLERWAMRIKIYFDEILYVRPLQSLKFTVKCCEWF